jgi:hypothetical protein
LAVRTPQLQVQQRKAFRRTCTKCLRVIILRSHAISHRDPGFQSYCCRILGTASWAATFRRHGHCERGVPMQSLCGSLDIPRLVIYSIDRLSTWNSD